MGSPGDLSGVPFEIYSNIRSGSPPGVPSESSPQVPADNPPKAIFAVAHWKSVPTRENQSKLQMLVFKC